MKRKKPSFNETYYGFRTFSHLLEEAQRKNIVVLRRDQKSGSYIVEDLGSGSTASVTTRNEAVAAPPPAAVSPAAPTSTAAASSAESSEAANGRGRGRRRPRGRGRIHSVPATGAAGTSSEAPADGGLEGRVAGPGPAEEADDHEGEPAGDHHVEPAMADHAPEPAPAPAAAAPSVRDSHDRFSLFSWIRREAPPARDEHTEDDGPKEPRDH
jgi:hypothetical protein